MIAFMMVLGMVPFQALSAEREVPVIVDLQKGLNSTVPANTVSGTAITAFVTSGTAIVYDGQTEDGNYTIEAAEQLATLASIVNVGTSYSDSTFTLLNSIELSGSWTPIGNLQTTPFSGTFDGGSNTISGLNISGNLSNQGLFGYLNNAEIKNLTVEGELINSTKNAKNIGGIAANAAESTFENCTNQVIISSSVAFSQFGGIIGNGTGLTFDNCINKVNITASTGTIIGGIIGTGNDITFNDCANEGNITAGATIGGIIASGKNLIFNNCTNKGNIKSSSTYVGGIAGNVTQTKVSFFNCRNIADVEGSGTVGGIVGQATGNAPSDIEMENCYNIGRIKGQQMLGGISMNIFQSRHLPLQNSPPWEGWSGN